MQSLRVSVRLSTKSSNNTVEEQGSQEMGRGGCLIREEISLGKCQVYVNSLEQEGGGDGILSVIRMSAKTTTILYVTSYIFDIFNRERRRLNLVHLFVSM